MVHSILFLFPCSSRVMVYDLKYPAEEVKRHPDGNLSSVTPLFHLQSLQLILFFHYRKMFV